MISGLDFIINSKVRHRSFSQKINPPSMPFAINRMTAYVFALNNFSPQPSKGYRIITEDNLEDAKGSGFLGMSSKTQTC